MPRILITSALPYVNNIPHLGNLIGSTLSADVYARHMRRRVGKDNVLYVCGADEHGTATENRAREEGISPQELCDKYEARHKEIYDWFGISFDAWGRTHTKEQEAITQHLFTRLHENGYIIEQDVEQLYDEEASQYLADRFVEGECPHCHYADARGDQCDNCGRLINAIELINPRSKLSGSTPVRKTSRHLFLDLPRLREEGLAAWIATVQDDWSKNARTTTQHWLADVKPRAITRDLKWGVPVPLAGFEDKVFYVWFDAPIGYISITKAACEYWEAWWRDPATRLVQFMGKDNIVFHSIIFPSVLIGSKEQWTLVDEMNTTEYLNFQDGKFSKSRGTGVFGDDCIAIEQEHGIPADAWRYYLVSIRPETADTTFSFADFQSRINNELIANYGNLVHRTLHFAHERIADEHRGAAPTDEGTRFLEATEALLAQADQHLDAGSLKEGLQEAMSAAKHANAWFQHQEPWKVAKEDPEAAARIIAALALAVKRITETIACVIPAMAGRVLGTLPEDGPILRLRMQPVVPINRIEDETIEALESRHGTPRVAALDLRVARITKASDHPDADKLLVLELDLGDEQRQLVAGLKGHYTTEELAGKHIIIVANLEEARIRGQRSQGMLLAAENDGVVGVLLAPEAAPGTRLSIGAQLPADKPITFKEFLTHELIASDDGVHVDGELLSGAELHVDRGLRGSLR